MPPKISRSDTTVLLQVKLPSQMKQQVIQLAQMDGDGDVSHWLRRQIHNAWREFEAGEALRGRARTKDGRKG